MKNLKKILAVIGPDEMALSDKLREILVDIYMWQEWYLKIYSKIWKSHLWLSRLFSTSKIWFSAMARQDELTHGSYFTVTSLMHTL